MSDFSGKTVLVVGGSRGIGAAIVSAFTSARAKVMFTYAGSEAAARTLSVETGAVAIQNDAADRESLRDAIDKAGPIDIFIYNAGLLVSGDPLSLDPNAVDRMIDVNVRGAYHASIEAARSMPPNGRIVLIGSVNADRVRFPGISAYAMTKSALQGLARGLARDFGPREITVNVVQPGPTDTDMNPSEGPFAGQMHAIMASGRHGTPKEVASLVLYLASPDAGGITGAMHTIDGGFAA
jgi:cyclic-di-GMP-binding biofilm dispersal mediator protein